MGEGIGAILFHGALIPFILAIVLVVQRESSITMVAIAFAIPVLMVAVGRFLLSSTATKACGSCGRKLPANRAGSSGLPSAYGFMRCSRAGQTRGPRSGPSPLEESQSARRTSLCSLVQSPTRSR